MTDDERIERKKKRIMSIIDNASIIASHAYHVDDFSNSKKYGFCADSFEWHDHEFIELTFWSKFANMSLCIRMHHENLNEFIQKYYQAMDEEDKKAFQALLVKEKGC